MTGNCLGRRLRTRGSYRFGRCGLVATRSGGNSRQAWANHRKASIKLIEDTGAPCSSAAVNMKQTKGANKGDAAPFVGRGGVAW
jgi:hypothetical protein